jgi:hypothetical protein
VTFFYLDIFFQNLDCRGITRYYPGNNPIRSFKGRYLLCHRSSAEKNDYRQLLIEGWWFSPIKLSAMRLYKCVRVYWSEQSFTGHGPEDT